MRASSTPTGCPDHGDPEERRHEAPREAKPAAGAVEKKVATAAAKKPAAGRSAGDRALAFGKKTLGSGAAGVVTWEGRERAMLSVARTREGLAACDRLGPAAVPIRKKLEAAR